ncbi:MAG: hypothetical protein LQ343_005345, partial [Gyalolechia ehrenbergii]
MSSSQSEQVLHALKLLNSVSEDVLKPHWGQVQAMFRKFQFQMQGCSIPPSATAVTATSSPIPQHSSSTSRSELGPVSGNPAQSTTSPGQFPGPNRNPAQTTTSPGQFPGPNRNPAQTTTGPGQFPGPNRNPAQTTTGP